jgi:hypothetical protein
MEKNAMTTLEASIEILKIVTSGQSLKGVDIDSKTDKILESFQKIYQRIDSIVNQDKKDNSWDDTLPETLDITLKGSTEVPVIDPSLKGGMNIDIMGLDITVKSSQE